MSYKSLGERIHLAKAGDHDDVSRIVVLVAFGHAKAETLSPTPSQKSELARFRCSSRKRVLAQLSSMAYPGTHAVLQVRTQSTTLFLSAYESSNLSTPNNY